MKKILLLSAVLMLSACGDGSDASENKLRKAINEDARFNRVCIPFQLDVEHRVYGENPHQSAFGAPELMLLKRLENGKRANEHALKQMEALVRAGLYKAEKEKRVSVGDKSLRYASYSLTERGQNEIVPKPHGALLCVGKYKVVKINYFTEPTATQGVTVTHVSYQAKVMPEKWAGSLLKETEYRDLPQERVEQSVTLMKTNDGWRNVRELH